MKAELVFRCPIRISEKSLREKSTVIDIPYLPQIGDRIDMLSKDTESFFTMIHKSYKDPNVVMMAAINRVKWITYSDDIPRIAVGNSPLHHLLFCNTETVEKNPKTYLMESTAVPRVGDRIIEDDWVVNAVILKGDEVVELEVVSIEDYEENL